jgi:RNA polymerase sigma factor (sigma-70 family)
MPDRPVTVPAQASPSATDSYARIYAEQQPRLVAYARSLTRNAWAAEDLVAEAHFRVWRRLSAGHEIDNVPAYLMTTVRHLASAAGTSARETPRDPQDPQRDERAEAGVHGDDPAEQVSSVDLLVRVLGQLPERWVKALWLAEAEGQPLAAIGPRIGTGQGATAVLLHRAREGMRQAFLRTQTGAPDDPACEVHWVRMPAYVRGSATARQSERLLGHVDTCDDCRQRLAVLMRANDRLPALVGPALLVFAVGGAGKFLLPFAAGSAGAVVSVGGHVGGLLHSVRGAVTGGSKAQSVAVGAAVAGAAVAACIAFGSMDPSPAPVPAEVPVAGAPVGPVPEDADAVPGETGDVADARGRDTAGTDPVAVVVRAGAPGPASGNGASSQDVPEPADAEVPATGAPEADVPTTEIPEAETPGSGGPEGDVPEVVVPGGEVPGSDVPEGDVPEGDVPGGDVPGGDVPSGDVPGGDVPSGDVPDADVPDGDVPGTGVPGGHVPGPDVPDDDAPEADGPKPDVPDADVPDVDVPETDAPEAEVPESEAPESEVPETESPAPTSPAPAPEPVEPTPVDPVPAEPVPTAPEPVPADPAPDDEDVPATPEEPGDGCGY